VIKYSLNSSGISNNVPLSFARNFEHNRTLESTHLLIEIASSAISTTNAAAADSDLIPPAPQPLSDRYVC
jgi:hypothetical protein